LLKPEAGTIRLDGDPLENRSTMEIVERGVIHVPEGRKLFPEMTVRDNLLLGGFHRAARPHQAERLEKVFAIFPRLLERRSQIAGTLSGGEQQMVAIGRALMARPRLICMDEPSMGLSPAFVDQVFEIIQTINKQGTTIFVVEQNAAMALSIADRGYVLQTGEVVLSGTAKSLLANEMVQKAYLGQMVA
jgi:branched-chain amino acid transport system ATP-binding protein